ncbi:cytochrome P450 [Epidermidibacterium keratini]|uniref:Bifunctional cytochrome P450/NADPH--P450 reductase n=1 Tax=Epidermidibacterium keratini TaxID=1891644 RepID=A0A7L4YPV3_9ACTN|nr:cytochrome P450 [Epidermidibacterium keratini]QHC01088.1 cytochrome P450 [Epidermidibacterium keratini]
MAEPASHAKIPGPTPKPLVGNLLDVVGGHTQIETIDELAAQYGGILELSVAGNRLIVASAHEYAAQMCGDPRWSKSVHQVLQQIRDFGGDGLFTAYNSEENWGKAHRLLMPAFGPMAIRDYFPRMLDIAEQMFTRWERFGAGHEVNVADDMTRLTLDTIALCAFDYRFNSFYAEQMHPFVDSMVRSLVEAGDRGRRLPGTQKLMVRTNRQYAADIDYMKQITREIVAERKKLPADQAPDDLLQRMLTAVDPLTGETLSEENIEYQLTTFLIAGHETTSGLLSFVTYELLANRDVLERARAVVDEVLGDRTPRFEDLAELGYLGQILRESLRLHPTAPAFALKPSEDVVLSGKYLIPARQPVMILLPTMHRDPAVWEDPDAFDPDRFAPGRLEQIPEYAWMPFGHGERACIGRPFALQEATLVLAMMLQRFDVDFAGPYTFELKETLTIKPADLVVTVTPRQTVRSEPAPETAPARAALPADAHGTPLLVLFGSNTGGSEGLARIVASEAVDRGWDAVAAPMDEYAGSLPTDGAVLVVTASYNGTPPDNAVKFVQWLDSLQDGDLAGVRYAVMGCGSRDWPATYQRIPTLVDDALAAAGAQRLRERGEADARSDFFGDWERWYRPFFDILGEQLGVTDSQVDSGPAYTVTEVTDDPLASELRLQPATVVENRELVNLDAADFARSKRHLEVRLPAGMSYRAGDYLAVLPQVHPELVARLARRVGLSPDAVVKVASRHSSAAVPTDRPVAVRDLLGRYLDLTLPATRGAIERLAASTPCPPERDALARLASDDAAYRSEVLDKRVGVADLLELYPSCQVDLGVLLEIVPAMRVRQYSISSSPLDSPDTASLTVSVVDAPARSGIGSYRGSGSSYLQSAQPGDKIAVALTHPSEQFRPPDDNATPVVLISAGSGIAPFRGFVRERVARDAAGEQAGPTVLFFGCDHPDVDDLYASEFAAYGDTVTVHRAYTFAPQDEVTFVQHRLWQQREQVAKLIADGARIYVCGDGEFMAPAVHETLARIHADTYGGGIERSLGWLDEMRDEGRYVTDVFG